MLPTHLRHLIDHLARLPGVGEKTATRFALYLITADHDTVRVLGEELQSLHTSVQPCSRCGFPADVPRDVSPSLVEGLISPILCGICRDPQRDSSVLCVVGRIQDLLAFERSGAMRGRYFVLSRLLSPLEGIGPEDLPLSALATRIAEDQVREVILATPPTVDGEATALLLARELKETGVRLTRIASGVPHGGDLEYADQITLGRSLAGRRPME